MRRPTCRALPVLLASLILAGISAGSTGCLMFADHERLAREMDDHNAWLPILGDLFFSEEDWSANARAFERARIGYYWTDREESLLGHINPDLLLDMRWGVACDWVVLTDNELVVAKAQDALSWLIHRRRRIEMDARDLAEFVDVASHYPFHQRDAQLVKLSLGPGIYPVWDYEPMRHPGRDGDRVLPSGVRQSTWAYLAWLLDGWPVTDRDRDPTVTLAGRRISWKELMRRMTRRPLRGKLLIEE